MFKIIIHFTVKLLDIFKFIEVSPPNLLKIVKNDKKRLIRLICNKNIL